MRPDAAPAPEATPAFSRAQWLADILRRRILDGHYESGERLREAVLGAEFGFSNGPIREALQLVVASGLAERAAAWQGVRVLCLTETEIVAIFQLRAALLEYAAELAARQAAPARLAEADSVRRQFDAAFARSRHGEARRGFSGVLTDWVLACADNRAIRESWDRGVLPARIYINAAIRHAAPADDGGGRAATVHALIDAVVAREPGAARAAARELTRQTLRDLGIAGEI